MTHTDLKAISADQTAVTDATDYMQGLAEHPDIPQADAGAARMIRERMLRCKRSAFSVLDLGCGPARLTKMIADELQPIAEQRRMELSIVGLDVDEGYLSYARSYMKNDRITYVLGDFMEVDLHRRFDVILMAGIFHHVRPNLRQPWLARCAEMLAPDGLIVINDEFIPDYNSAEDRVLNVAGLYAYVVGYALQNGHGPLADIESMNMVDDVCAGLPGAGHSNKSLLTTIQDASRQIYASIYDRGVANQDYREALRTLVARIQGESSQIAVTDSHNHDRGDYKVSVEKQADALAEFGFGLVKKQINGPVAWVGGMGTLGFARTSH